MTAQILSFDFCFSATGMSATEIRDEVKRRGWYSFTMDTQRALHGDGVLVIYRMSRKAVCGE